MAAIGESRRAASPRAAGGAHLRSRQVVGGRPAATGHVPHPRKARSAVAAAKRCRLARQGVRRRRPADGLVAPALPTVAAARRLPEPRRLRRLRRGASGLPARLRRAVDDHRVAGLTRPARLGRRGSKVQATRKVAAPARRARAPTRLKPKIMKAHTDGSGTAPVDEPKPLNTASSKRLSSPPVLYSVLKPMP